MFYYKLSTVQPINQKNIVTFFDKYILSKTIKKNKISYICNDGSILILSESFCEGAFFVEYHYKFTPIPEKKCIFLKNIEDFCKFCSENNTDIKILRNKSVIPSSFGALFSDMKHSRSFKQALHQANYPKDKSCKF